MGVEFAAKYPKIASRLVLEPDKCEDPHVERLLEAFAFLAARVHLKIDDEFPEITEALLSILYPHYMRPIPSMSVVEFHMDSSQAVPPGGLKLDRGAVLNSRPVNGVPCKFRTCYDLTFWPLAVAEAEWKTPDRLQPPVKSSEAVAAVRIGAAMSGRLEVREAGALLAAVLPERRKQPGAHAVRTAVQQLQPHRGAGSSPKSKAQPVILRRRRAAAGRFRRRRRHAAVPAAFLHRLPAAAGVLLFPAEVFLPGSHGARADLRGRIRRAGGNPPADFALRARRAPADCWNWGSARRPSGWTALPS